MLFGLLPAWKAAHVNVEPASKIRRAQQRLVVLARVRKTLIVSELTLALMLLIGASLAGEELLEANERRSRVRS